MLENGRGVNSVPQYRALRNNRFLYVRHDTTGEHELYDLRKDPFELKNLEDSDRYAAIRARCSPGGCARSQRCRGRTCFKSKPSVKVALHQVQPKRKKKKRRTRKNQTCVSRDISLSLFGREGRRVESVRYTASGRRLGSSRRRPFRLTVKRSKLRAGRKLIVRARIATIDGRVVTVDRKTHHLPEVREPQRGAYGALATPGARRPASSCSAALGDLLALGLDLVRVRRPVRLGIRAACRAGTPRRRAPRHSPSPAAVTAWR